jgi:hypothetical protein
MQLAILFYLAWAGWPALCSALTADCQYVFTERWTSPARLIEFPENISLGTLTMQADWHRSNVPPPRLRPAQGKILVPRDQLVTFQPNAEFFAHPQSIAKLAPGAIDCLEFKLMAMDEAEEALCGQALGHIGHLKNLKILILDKSDISDQALKQIAGLGDLQYLSAFLCGLNGTCIKDLRSLKKLHSLILPGNSLQEDELRYLPELPALEHLLLSHTNVTNKGLKYIAGCKNLIRLDLSKNPGVDDGGVQYLKQLTKMRTLSLDDTSLSCKGIAQLKNLELTDLVLTKLKYSPAELAQLHKTFPKARFQFRGGPKQVDDETNTIFGKMSR